MTLLTIKECTELVDWSVAWITTLCRDGEIPYTEGLSETGQVKYFVRKAHLLAAWEARKKRPSWRGARIIIDLPKCPRCTIVLAMAPEGHNGEMCNVCVMDLERINGNESDLQN